MATDKRITELPVSSGIGANDVSVLVNNGVDYQFSISLLLQFLSSNLSTGASITFGTTIPTNSAGKNGDVFVKTNSGQFIQKKSGIWTVVFTLPTLEEPADGTVLYGTGVPGSVIGKDNDTYINTLTGVFYKKVSGTWIQVFSMQTGPQGAKGDKGDTGAAGAAGKTLLSGTGNPSNLNTGTNGDFYINTNTMRLFGPKTSGNWGLGISLVQAVSDERYQANTATPTLSNWQTLDAMFYGNYPRVRLFIEDEDGNEVEAPGASPKYTIDRSDPANPLVTQISWDLAAPANCRILIN